MGAQTGGVHRTNSISSPWMAMNSGLINTEAYSFAHLDNILFVGTGNVVLRSTDLGTTWTPSGMDGYITYALHETNGLLFAGKGNAGVYLSQDTGQTWLPLNTDLPSVEVVAITSDDTYLYAGRSTVALPVLPSWTCPSVSTRPLHLHSPCRGRGPIWVAVG